MSNKRVLYMLLLFGVGAGAVSGFALEGPSFVSRVTGTDSPSHAALQVAGASTGIPMVATAEHEDLKALVFAIRPSGITPNEITVAEGRYLIVLQNRTRRRDLVFLIDRENGERVKEIRQERLDWKQQFDLHPGNYIISEATHAELRCVIRVTPR